MTKADKGGYLVAGLFEVKLALTATASCVFACAADGKHFVGTWGIPYTWLEGWRLFCNACFRVPAAVKLAVVVRPTTFGHIYDSQ